MPEVDAFAGDANSTTIYRGVDLHPEFKQKSATYGANSFEELFFKTPCYVPSSNPAFPLSDLLPGPCKFIYFLIYFPARKLKELFQTYARREPCTIRR